MSPPNIPQTQSRTKIHELSDFELAEFKQAFEEFDKVKKISIGFKYFFIFSLTSILYKYEQ